MTEGAYVVYDVANGWGAEGTVSANIGTLQINHTEQVWFSSLFD